MPGVCTGGFCGYFFFCFFSNEFLCRTVKQIPWCDTRPCWNDRFKIFFFFSYHFFVLSALARDILLRKCGRIPFVCRFNFGYSRLCLSELVLAKSIRRIVRVTEVIDSIDSRY